MINLTDFLGHEGATIKTYLSFADTSDVSTGLSTLLRLVADGKLALPIASRSSWTPPTVALQVAPGTALRRRDHNYADRRVAPLATQPGSSRTAIAVTFMQVRRLL